jgi:uncharacterized membrane protein
MNYTAKLLISASTAALGMFAVYIWLPEWTGAIGVLIGFSYVLIVEKFGPPRSFIKDISLFGLFAFTTILSYIILLLACVYILSTDQCGQMSKESFLLSSILYPAVPIVPLYIFVWLPRHFKNWLRK